MSIEKIINPTKLDIIFIVNYKNPHVNSLKEFREDLLSIENTKRYVKNFYVKKNIISFKKLFNNFLLISNIFPEKSYQEILNYIGYKYFFRENKLFDFYVNIVFCFFDIRIDESKLNQEHIEFLNGFISL